MKGKKLKHIAIIIAMILSLNLCMLCLAACDYLRQEFWEIKATWIYESEDLNIIFNTDGIHSEFTGTIIKDGKSIDVICASYAPDDEFSVYTKEGLDTSSPRWNVKYFDHLLFGGRVKLKNDGIILHTLRTPTADTAQENLTNWNRFDLEFFLKKQEA